MINYYGQGKNTRFSDLTGVGEASLRGYLKGILPKADFFEKVARYCEGISMEWLITGQGNMLKSEAASPPQYTGTGEMLVSDVPAQYCSQEIDKQSMLNQLVQYYGHGKKNQFANKLGVKPQTINTWLSRNTFDTELIYAKCEGVSADWLLTGQGKMLKSDADYPPQYADINASALYEMIQQTQDQITENMRQVKKTQEQIDLLLRHIKSNNQ